MFTLEGVGSRSTQRALRHSRSSLKKSLQRLSTGTRLNSAADDAAGQSTAQRMQAEVRGKAQAIRNANDGMSMLRTLDDALSEVTENLQRMRELAVQSKQETLTAADRQALLVEFQAITEEIDRIGSTTQFNGVSVTGGSTQVTGLSASDDSLIEKLRSSWLRQSEILVEQYYGIVGDGAEMDMDVRAIDGPYNVAAYVQASFYSLAYNPAGTGFNLQFVIDTDDYTVFGDQYDRIIAHEMVHAVMDRTVNMYATADGSTAGSGSWFKEGTAEFIPGADDRVTGTLTRHTEQEIVDRVVELVGGAAWGGGGAHGFSTADDYTAGYIAVRYLHDRIKSAGGEGIKDIFTYLKETTGAGVEQALQNIASGSYAGGLADFATDFTTNGLAFVQAMDLSNDDVGAIGGYDVDGGAVRDADDVIPDVYAYAEQPLEYFDLTWPLVNEISLDARSTTTLQVGSGNGDTVEVQLLAVNSDSLGLDEVDLSSSTGFAVGRMDRAIDLVSEAQASVGAAMSRLEATIGAEANARAQLAEGQARIEAADFATESADFARARILQNVSSAMIAQSNSSGAVLLTLLGI